MSTSLQPFAKETLGTAGLVIMSLLASSSSFGSANGNVFRASRELFVSAREGQTPVVLSELHVSAGTPVPAILVTVSVRSWGAGEGGADVVLFVCCFSYY